MRTRRRERRRWKRRSRRRPRQRTCRARKRTRRRARRRWKRRSRRRPRRQTCRARKRTRHRARRWKRRSRRRPRQRTCPRPEADAPSRAASVEAEKPAASGDAAVRTPCAFPSGWAASGMSTGAPRRLPPSFARRMASTASEVSGWTPRRRLPRPRSKGAIVGASSCANGIAGVVQQALRIAAAARIGNIAAPAGCACLRAVRVGGHRGCRAPRPSARRPSRGHRGAARPRLPARRPCRGTSRLPRAAPRRLVGGVMPAKGSSPAALRPRGLDGPPAPRDWAHRAARGGCAAARVVNIEHAFVFRATMRRCSLSWRSAAAFSRDQRRKRPALPVAVSDSSASSSVASSPPHLPKYAYSGHASSAPIAPPPAP